MVRVEPQGAVRLNAARPWANQFCFPMQLGRLTSSASTTRAGNRENSLRGNTHQLDTMPTPLRITPPFSPGSRLPIIILSRPRQH